MRKINGYGWYTAAYCRSTGLPIYDKRTYSDVAETLLSTTRCKKIKMPVKDGEEPVAFYRVDRGYCGLYKREKGGELGMKKCGTCKIAHEMPDMACCAWYMDNVVCGDKTTEDCTEYIPCDKEKGGAE